MDSKKPNGKLFSRRGILPILGGSLLVPFIGAAQRDVETSELEEKETEYKTLLRPDGTAVKVKVSALEKSKVVKKKISNKSFLNWIGKKL
ncbi:hypothetical protein [Lutimonas vermicola]|uniref:Uncharacterized protein n=1 Tax=Lutimonas vermicola TaxID=414288 RepID=A0ABU9L283_9FLAO